MDCIKRQEIINRAAGTSKCRCLNKASSFYGLTVTESMCAECPVPVQRKKDPPCAAPPGRPVGEKPVSTGEILKMSTAEMEELMHAAGLEPDPDELKELTMSTTPGYPPVTLQLWMYKEALIRWNKAGRPTRSQEEVRRIHAEHCNPPGAPCEYYDAKKKRCKGCGCRVTEGSIAILNKIKMATEHCPKDRW